MSIVQEIFNYYLNKIHQGDINENLKELLEFLEEAKNINICTDKLEDILLEIVSDDEADLLILYKFDKYIPGLKDRIDNVIKSNMTMSKIRCEYILTTKTTDEEFVTLATNAIKDVMVGYTEHLYLLDEVKNMAKKRNLHDRIINNIKTSGNTDMIICAALSYEDSLINEIFGSIEAMYLYLSTSKFVDADAIEIYKERLLDIDSYSKNNIYKNNKNINQKIKELKKID